MEELITCDELCSRLKLKRQTIYNMIYRKEFTINKHYFKPTKRILLFDWDAVKVWLLGPEANAETIIIIEGRSASSIAQKATEKTQPPSRINI